MKSQIAVVGGGVSGLTTALRLQEAGYTVRIITEKTFEATASWVAAAIWFPFKVQPQALTNEWSLFTFHKLEHLSKQAQTGVFMVPLNLYVAKEEDATWKNAYPPGKIKRIDPEKLPANIPVGFSAAVPPQETVS